MAMSMSILAIREEDDQYRKMAAAYHACESAGVELPREVEKYFEDAAPSGGPVTQLPIFGVDKHPAIEPFNAYMQEGITVDISKLPPGTSKIRFVCTW